MPTAEANGKTFEFPEGTTPEQMGQAIDEYFAGQSQDAGRFDGVVGGLDATLSVGSSILAEPLAGMAGLATAINPFDGIPASESGDVVDWARQGLTYDPKTQDGRDKLKSLANALKPVTEILEKAEKASGDFGYDIAGPIGGAIGASLPTLLMEATALAGAKGLAKVPVDEVAATTLTNASQAAKELGQEVATVGQAAKETVKDVAIAPTQITRREQREALQADPESAAGAGFKLDEKGRARTNTAEQRAQSMGWQDDDIGMIRGASTIDRNKAEKMLDIYERGKDNKRYRLTHSPGDVVGDTLMDRVMHLRDRNKAAGEAIGRVAEGLKTSPVDIRGAYKEFAEGLKELGVTLKGADGKFKADFSKADFEGVTGAERLVNTMLSRLQRPTEANGYNVHKLKRFIDTQVSYGKMQRDLSGDVERLVKDFRHNIDEALDTTFPDYNKANIEYADTIDVIDAFQSRLGKKVDLTNKRARTMLGQEARKLMSNYKVRGEMLAELDELDAMYRKYGGKATDDILFQTAFVNTLESTLGAYRPGTAQGIIESAGRNLMTGNVKGGAVDMAVSAAEKAADKIKGVTPKNQMQAMRELLKQKGTSNSREVSIRDS